MLKSSHIRGSSHQNGLFVFAPKIVLEFDHVAKPMAYFEVDENRLITNYESVYSSNG